jgi:CheY-like chemotaxis protein
MRRETKVAGSIRPACGHLAEGLDEVVREAVGPFTVLVATPDPAELELLRGVLQTHGYRCDGAPDGPTALSLARKHRPELVVIDPGLFAEEGVTAARALRAEPGLRRTALIALAEAALSVNTRMFDAVLLRPVDPDALLSLLAERVGEMDLEGHADALLASLSLETVLPSSISIPDPTRNLALVRRIRMQLTRAGLAYREDESGPERVFRFRATLGQLLDLGVGREVADELVHSFLHAYPSLRFRLPSLEARLAELWAAHGHRAGLRAG